MITLCTVTLRQVDQYIKVLLESLARKTHVKDVIIVRIDGDQSGVLDQREENGIRVRVFGNPLVNSGHPLHNFINALGGHALGLHYALDHVTTEYVWFCDPDIFFFSSVDQIYLELMERYRLFTIGVGHFWRAQQSYLDFPCITNLLIKKADLPPIDWLQSELFLQPTMKMADPSVRLIPFKGKYLLPGLTSHAAEFPNPQGMFDAGCNLWLWAKQRGGRWLAFQLDHDLQHCNHTNRNFGFPELIYPLNYTTANYTSNFGLADDLGDKPLLYHRTMAAQVESKEFIALYERLVKEGVA